MGDGFEYNHTNSFPENNNNVYKVRLQSRKGERENLVAFADRVTQERGKTAIIYVVNYSDKKCLVELEGSWILSCDMPHTF